MVREWPRGPTVVTWPKSGHVAELCDLCCTNEATASGNFLDIQMTRILLYFLPEGGCITGAPLDLKAGGSCSPGMSEWQARNIMDPGGLNFLGTLTSLPAVL